MIPGMTQTAPGTAPAPVPLERVTHWIDGKPFAGVTERAAPVYDPALGTVRLGTPADTPRIPSGVTSEWSPPSAIGDVPLRRAAGH